MPVRHQDHGRVPVTVTIVLCGLDELFNLGLGQVLSTAKLTVWPAPRGNCSFLGGWLHQPQVRFCWHSRLLSFYTARTIVIIRAVCKAILGLTWPAYDGKHRQHGSYRGSEGVRAEQTRHARIDERSTGSVIDRGG